MATQSSTIQNPRVVSHEQWVTERVAFIAKEKEFTRLRDELSRQRRELPWEKVTKSYVFDGPHGKETLAELFEDRSQLIVYHFMFDPAWDEGCKSCSFCRRQLRRERSCTSPPRHLFRGDLARAARQVQRFKQRMGWRFPWLSSFGTDFNYDFERDDDESHTEYNYAPVSAQPPGRPYKGEREGLSVFLRDGDRLFHTYSTYQRGLDPLINTYNLLDLTPLGRHEDGRIMAWLRHHDQYQD